MSKLFTVAGTSNLEGVVKFRVANGSADARTKVLVRSGHTDIKLVDLAKPMTKEAAIEFVKSKGFIAAAEKPVAAKPAKPAKVAKTPAAKAPKLKVVAKADTKALTEEFEALSKRAVEADRNFVKAAADAGVEATLAPQPTPNSINEIAKIKAKNLETMRRVTNRLRAVREF